MMTRLLSLFALSSILLIAGCNAFGGLGEQEGDSTDPAMLVQDAEMALQRGEPAKAEQYLRKALRLDPQHTNARITLSTALLAKSDIGVVDLRRMIRTLRGEGDAAAVAAGQRALALMPRAEASAPRTRAPGDDAICSFDGRSFDKAVSFKPDEIERFSVFQPSQQALEEIRALIARVLNTDETNIEDFDGSDIQATIDSLRNKEGLSDEQISTIILNDAVATTTLAYLDFSQSARDNYDYFYIDPDTTQMGDRYLGYCAPTQPQYDEATQVLACNQSELAYTRDLLRARVNTVPEGESIAQEIADAYDLAYDAAYEDIAPGTCESGSSNILASW